MLRMDFTSQDYLRDPAKGLAKLRSVGPVVEVRFPIIGKTWITTTSELGTIRACAASSTKPSVGAPFSRCNREFW
jgi:hypothetical protein